MTVYVLRAMNTDLVKIGFTKAPTPVERMSDLRTGCPYRLVVLTFLPDAPRSLERDLHDQFRLHRVSGEGREWFSLNHEQRLALVEQLGRPVVATVERSAFYEGACTQESGFGLVVFGPHTPYDGYLGVYDDEGHEFCHEHEALMQKQSLEQFEQERETRLDCPNCLIDAACVYIDGGCVVVPHHDFRPATKEESFLRPLAMGGR